MALLARRLDRLEDAAAEAGDGAIALRCDVTEESSCRQGVDEAADRLGGIDALVYSTGMGPLARLAETDAGTWRQVLDTNLVGAALVTAAALPHLAASGGVAAYLSSVSASETPPWPGLGADVVSKAALERLVDAWRTEHPGIGFTRVVVGDCAGGEGPSMTEFPAGWDPELAVEMGSIWAARNYLSGSLLDVEDLVDAVDTVLRCGAGASVPSITVGPRPQPPQ